MGRDLSYTVFVGKTIKEIQKEIDESEKFGDVELDEGRNTITYMEGNIFTKKDIKAHLKNSIKKGELGNIIAWGLIFKNMYVSSSHDLENDICIVVWSC